MILGQVINVSSPLLILPFYKLSFNMVEKRNISSLRLPFSSLVQFFLFWSRFFGIRSFHMGIDGCYMYAYHRWYVFYVLYP
jgi:hypothetical protein